MTDTTTQDRATVEARKKAEETERMKQEAHRETNGKDAGEEKKSDTK
jgi:hypothetical protein